MLHVPTVIARSVRKIADIAADRGNADHLLRTVGLDREAIGDDTLKIPYADMMLLTERAAWTIGDSAFGLHVGEHVAQHEYGIIGEAITSSPTLGEALHTLARYLPLWTDVGVFKLDVDGPVAHFQWQYSHSSLPEPRHDCETSMATLMGLNRLAVSGWRPREVWFQHAKPKDTSEHARIFRAPVRFGMPANAMLLDRSLLNLRFRTADPDRHQLLTRKAEDLLPEAADETSFSQAVLSLIRQNLNHGNFDLESAARSLGVSRRTLQRKLSEEHRSYRQLMEEARQDLSQYLLRDTPATATATAYALGYSEPSIFHRAFQKWHGKPPGAFRRS
jgi:AraC-like DNA-binding protein